MRHLPALLAVAAALCGCAPDPDVVIYCALDQVDSEPILREFERRTGRIKLGELVGLWTGSD